MQRFPPPLTRPWLDRTHTFWNILSMSQKSKCMNHSRGIWRWIQTDRDKESRWKDTSNSSQTFYCWAMYCFHLSSPYEDTRSSSFVIRDNLPVHVIKWGISCHRIGWNVVKRPKWPFLWQIPIRLKTVVNAGDEFSRSCIRTHSTRTHRSKVETLNIITAAKNFNGIHKFIRLHSISDHNMFHFLCIQFTCHYNIRARSEASQTST